MCEKNKITKKTGPRTSISLEEKFLASCQNSQGTSWFKRSEKTKKKQHARLPAQVPASSVSKSPGGNERQERKDAVTGQNDGKHQADNRVGKTGARGGKRRRTVQSSATCGGKRQWCLGSFEPIVPSHAWQNDVRASLDNTWQIPPHAATSGFRAGRNQRPSQNKTFRVSSDKHNEEA